MSKQMLRLLMEARRKQAASKDPHGIVFGTNNLDVMMLQVILQESVRELRALHRDPKELDVPTSDYGKAIEDAVSALTKLLSA